VAWRYAVAVSAPQQPVGDSAAGDRAAGDPDAVVPAPPLIPPPPPLGAVPLPAPAPAPILPPPPPPALLGPPAPPVAPPAPPWISLDRPAAPPAVASSDARPVATPLIAAPREPDAADDLDRTIVVDRRPTTPWQLVIEGGPTLRLVGSRVVLGRQPAGAGGGAHELAIPDPTRTLSKVHALLELADGAWTVTDLNATNGVIAIDVDGTENLLDPGASAPIVERLVLGKVAMRITSEIGEATL
jgi:hypothetical protein